MDNNQIDILDVPVPVPFGVLTLLPGKKPQLSQAALLVSKSHTSPDLVLLYQKKENEEKM